MVAAGGGTLRQPALVNLLLANLAIMLSGLIDPQERGRERGMERNSNREIMSVFKHGRCDFIMLSEKVTFQ